MLIEEHQVEWDDHYPIRVDKYMSDILGYLTRSQLKNRTREVYINGKLAKLSKTVKDEDFIRLCLTDPPSLDIKAEPIPLDILYEDKDCLVLNKVQGMVVHPAQGNYTGTLVHGLLYHLKNHEDNFEEANLRPGIVHRLDKDTSGVIITAKSQDSLEYFAEQFRNRETHKQYLAIIKGLLPQKEGQVEGYIKRDEVNRKIFEMHDAKGKHSLTKWKVLEEWSDYSLVELSPVTGRTHQLRVHMKELGCPILGDPLYARKDKIYKDASLCLHAFHLEIRLPIDGQVHSFEASLPLHMLNLIDQLRTMGG
ncbi:RluA family pseudouridine synthase [Spirochaeta cellobiosiphila]|uniref:RluA family pseudouridine synthase n=1 Tax=Spirochaeta cellobiosiphila TaxID=504483 RepID=UPI00041E1984|nr:RluA family pseudouridine synthase [Spirochaeta cellobiosiphila]